MIKNELRLSFRSIIKRGNFLYFFIFYIYGFIMDIRIAGRSMNGTMFNHRDGVYAVQCISYPYLRKLIKVLNYSNNDVFVDVGCAWGRLLGFLEKKTSIKKLIGVEINSNAASFAKKHFQKSQRVEIKYGDIIQEFPDKGTVFFLFNPFDRVFLEEFLFKLEQTINHPIRLLYLYPTCRDVIENRSHCWKLLKETELIPRHLSPILLCEYLYCPNNT